MKRRFFITVIAVLTLVLVSCGNGTPGSNNNNNNNNQNGTGGGGGSNRIIYRTIDENFIQRVGNWDVELWRDDRGHGDAVMNIYTDGTFSGSWTQGYNTLLRVGRKWRGANNVVNVNTHSNITVRYEVSEFTSNRGATYLTLYGWTRDPLIEWYIVERWIDWTPATVGGAASGYRHHGTVTVNGGVYDIVTGWRVNQPSIQGTQTFLQIFSVRRGSQGQRNQANPTSGIIDVSAHFAAWEELIGEQTHTVGGTTHRSRFSGLARLDEIAFTIEGFGGQDRSTGKGVVEALRLQYGNNVICTGTFSTPTQGCLVCGGTR